MNSYRTKQFRALLRGLPIEVRRQAYADYRLFKRDPYHPSLHFKQVNSKKALYSVRIGIMYRALGIRATGGEIVWFWIGTHDEYNKILGRF